MSPELGPQGTPPGVGMAGLGTESTQPQHQTPHALGRLMRYLEYQAMYTGDQWTDLPGPSEVRLTLNYCRVFINKMASYLYSKPVGYDAVGGGQGSGAGRRNDEGRRVEEWLGEWSAANDLPGLDLEGAVTAGVLGDGAYTVRWDGEIGYPKVTAVDPAGLDARWRTDDHRTLLWVRQSYWVSPVELTGAQEAMLAANNVAMDAYTPLAAYEDWTAKGWKLVVGGVEVDGGPNPYGEIPYVMWPNLRLPGEFWGESDLVDIIEMQRELNKRVSTFARLLQLCGNPITVIEGATDEETAELRLGPNMMWTLPEKARAYVLDLLGAGGVDAHFKYLDVLYRCMHDISEMPRTSFGDSSGQSQARSGVALEIELQPLLHKLARKRSILGSMLLKRARLAMKIARTHGAALPEGVAVNVIWPAVLPQDRATLVTQETALVGAGIHPPTLAIKLLEDPDPDEVFAQVLEQGRKLKEAGLPTPGQKDSGGFAGRQTALPAPNGKGKAQKEQSM